MDTINVIINKIIYKATDSNYTICNFDVSGKYIDLIAKGNMSVEEGKKYIFIGEFKDDDRYGEYFNVNICKEEEISTSDSIIEYLCSNKFTGIGRRTASKIYNEFKDQTLDVIVHEPHKLIELGISENIVDELTSKHVEQNIHLKLFELLSEININEYVINNLYDYVETNKVNNYNKILKNEPYYFIDHVYGFTFSIADSIYLHFNSDLINSKIRISSLIKYYTYNKCFETGDTKITYDDVILYVMSKTTIDKITLEENIQELVNEEEIIKHDNYLISKKIFDDASFLARAIKMKLKSNSDDIYDEIFLHAHITKLQEQFKINYSEKQISAIIDCLNNNISIITGGPGTGKTTIIKAITNLYDKVNELDDLSERKILLCAPTGRAAQRMKEATGYKALTIHSALNWDPYNGKFNKNETDNLQYDLIIIDEFSMVDIFVASALFKAIKPNSKVIIVGDSAQLESVGPGSILRDLIKSKLIKTHSLNMIYRQGEGSSIAKLAHQIDGDDKLELINTNDMSVISRDGNLVNLVKSIVDKSLEAGYDQTDIQVLYPKYNGINGIINLNKALKPKLKDNFINSNNTEYQVGDKVMQLKNNYELNIYNGDIGFITNIYNNNATNKEVAIEIDFGRIKVDLSKKDMEDITHAYAISIHKSQGSEFKVIIIPITSECKNMLSKKLIYTAITRAKDKLILIGDMSYLDLGLNLKDYDRKTFLYELLITEE